MELLQGVATNLRLPEHGADPVAFTEAPEVTITRDSSGAELEGLEVKRVPEDEEEELEYWAVALTGEQLAEVDILTAIWSDGDSSYAQTVEIVGGQVCSVEEIKEKQGEEPGTLEVEAKREIATRDIEDACGVAFRTRYRKELINGKGTGRLTLAKRGLQRVIRVVVDGSALSEVELEALTLDPIGVVISESTWPRGRNNIEIAYAYGYLNTAAAKTPVRDYAAYLLAETPMDWQGRATSFTNEIGVTYQLVTPGVRGSRFPLPSVNAFVDQYSAPLVG